MTVSSLNDLLDDAGCVPKAANGLKLAYGFGADAFAEIEYRFTAERQKVSPTEAI